MNSAADRPRSSALRLWSAVLFLAALALYLGLAPPVDGDGDASEFTLGLALAGVPHPTGYPLYILVGHVVVRFLHALGLGWSMAATTWSALGAALAVVLTHRLGTKMAARAMSGGRVAGGADSRDASVDAVWLALIPAALLGLSPAFLPSATQAEVYSWHLAWFMGAALVLWDGLVEEPGARLDRVALAWGLMVGLGLAHHRTSLFLILSGSAALIGSSWRRGALTPARVLAAVAAAAVPLLGNLWILYRGSHPAAQQWPLLTPGLAGAWEHIKGSVYARAYLGGFAPTADQRHLLNVAVMPLLIPGLAALTLQLIRGRDVGARLWGGAMLLGSAVQLLFVFRFGVPDPLAHFVTPMAAGLLGATWWLGAIGPRLPRRSVVAGAVVATLAAGALALPGTLAYRARQIGIDARVRHAWRAIPFDDGIVVWQNDWYCRLLAWQILEHDRPGLIVANPVVLTWEGPRRDFERRTGIDPLAGLALRSDADLPMIGENIARRSNRPVIDFNQQLAITPR